VTSATQAARLHAGVSEESRQIALLAASGESVGQFWTHAPTCRREAFENLWFRTSLRQRLHLSITSRGHLCQLRKAERGDERCLKELSERHVYCCQTGLARFRPHRHVLVTLADVLRGLGAHVDMERYCADLLRQRQDGSSEEAWMDVCAQFAGSPDLWRLDVTIRSPWAQGGRAATKAGVAATAGVKAKCERYGASVAAIVFEPLGRLAADSASTLWALARQARDLRITERAPSLEYRRLRLCLERTLLWASAEKLILATGRQQQ
jgi:hypothetical protein